MSRFDPDRLYTLLPAVYRMRDAELDQPLRALLQVISEQVNLVEADIDQLYASWFIETCQDWVVPYIGDLIGYHPMQTVGISGAITTAGGQQRNRALIPRRDVAHTIGDRRRKGSLALLDKLANDVAGWPARAVEFYPLLDLAESVRHLRLDRGRTVDLRRGDALDRIDSAFDQLAHTVSVGRINSARSQRRYNIPSVGLFIWRLKPYSITYAPAFCVDRVNNHYTFSILGNDTRLITSPVTEPLPDQISGELNVPAWIRRRAFDERTADYYGLHKSLTIWRDDQADPVPLHSIVPADLSNWAYRPQQDQVAVDPRLGRMVFSPRNAPRQGVWVTYHYGFSDDVGGGEYSRVLRPTDDFIVDDGETPMSPATEVVAEKRLYRVGAGETLTTIRQALERWSNRRPADAIIEITDNGVYVEQLQILLDAGQRLELRAANRRRPTIRLLDWYTNRSDALQIGRRPQPTGGVEAVADRPEGAGNGEADVSQDEAATVAPGPARFILDGVLVTGRGIQVVGDLSQVVIRHCTLVPGWAIQHDCTPVNETEPSVEIVDSSAKLTIEHTILGAIRVNESEVERDPIPISISDSVLDATRPTHDALSAPDGLHAHAVLTLLRSTVFGRIAVRAIELAENSIFDGLVRVARRQAGCVRFCYVPPDSRTPRRYDCQPDLVVAAVQARFQAGQPTPQERDSELARETLRVRPQFNSVRYGTPTYCQLADTCASEIRSGADDEAAMGAFHDLFEPQREANLQTRLDEYTPAGMDVGMIFVS